MTRRVLGLALAATGLLLQASALAAPSTRTTALDYPSAWRCDQAKFNWYCDVDEARAEETPAPEPAKKAKTREDEAIERLEAWQKELKAKRALSILEPTPENVRAYIEAQEKMMQSASVYSDVWRRVIWQNPDLNYELKRRSTTPRSRPTPTAAKQRKRRRSTRSTRSGAFSSSSVPIARTVIASRRRSSS
jgi:hypothetical protein